MRILLVNAKPQTAAEPFKKAYTTLPNGILYIAAVLERAGHEVPGVRRVHRRAAA